VKKDIIHPVVEDIAVAIVKEQDEKGGLVWNVYLLNLKKEDIEGVLVTSSGYGELGGEHRKTSTLRHFLDIVPSRTFAKIEPIMQDLFGISNQYWVSFYLNKQIYDKKYVFLAESVREENFITIPLVKKKGVMIK
jgi:hypothetical protein